MNSITQEINYSVMAFGLSLAAALYGHSSLSIVLLFFSGVISKNRSIEFRKPDIIFITFLVAIFLINLTSTYSRNALNELIPLGLAYGLSIYIFFLIKANCEHLHQALCLLTCCFFISSIDLLSNFIFTENASSLGIIETSITSAFIVPNDYALFAIAMPLFSFSLGYFPVSKKWSFPILYVVGFLTAVILNSRLCLLILTISLATEYRILESSFGKRALKAIILVVSIGVSLTPNLVDKLQSLPTSRIPLWDAATHQTFQHPWLGMGLDSFGGFYANHIDTTSYPDLIVVDRRTMPWPHNLFLELSSSFGLVFLALIVVGSVILVVKTRHLKDPLFGAVSSTSVLFLIAGTFELTYLRIYPVILIVFLASIAVAFLSRKSCVTKL